MERNAIDLGTVDVPKLFRRMFLPTLFGMLSISAVTAVDGIFIGHGVGSDGIAAVNLCVPVMMVFTGLGLMMGVGCSVVAAVHLSRSQARAARINVTQALAFVSAVTVAATTLIVVFARQTALAMGSSERLLPLVVDYLQWFMPSMVFQMWVSISLFIIRLDGAPRVAMWCSVVSAALNVVLDYIFIFPLGWGVRGAAFATSLSVATGGVMALGLPALLRPHAATREGEAEREEHAPDGAQPRLPVPHRVVDAARRADAGDAHVRGQRHLHALPGRRRRGCLRRGVLLYALRLHGGQRHSAVGAAHPELQLRRGQLRARVAGRPPGRAHGRRVRRRGDAGLHGRARRAGGALPRERGRGGAHRHRRPALLLGRIHLLRGQPGRHRLQPEPRTHGRLDVVRTAARGAVPRCRASW